MSDQVTEMTLFLSFSLPFACSAELMSDNIPANTGADAEVPETGLAEPPEKC